MDDLRKQRDRRDVPDDSEIIERNRCGLKIIADTFFFHKVGNRQLPFTSRYIVRPFLCEWLLFLYLQVNLYDRINQIFTKTDFGSDPRGKRLVNLGFTIKVREFIYFA